MRRRLRFVGAPDPTDIFKDLDALRQGKPSGCRQRAAETFARIPHDRALALRPRPSGTAWLLLFELDRLILRSHGRNPIRLSSARLRGTGISHRSRKRALRGLEAAGAVRVERQGKGQPPLVLHLWYPRRE